MRSIFIAFIAFVFSGFRQFEHLKLALIIVKIVSHFFKSDYVMVAYGKKNSELVFYPLKVHSAIHKF